MWGGAGNGGTLTVVLLLLVLLLRVSLLRVLLLRVQVDTLKSVAYEQDMFESSRCPICLVDYVVDETLRVLPCEHHFHQGCIDRWLVGRLPVPHFMAFLV